MKTFLSNSILAAILITVTILPNPACCQSSGFLYGITWSGGQRGNGTVFKYDLSTGNQQVVIDFDSSKGLYPLGNLERNNTNGLIYGTTYQGGRSNDGVMFSYNASTGQDTVVSEFNGLNGKSPQQGNLASYNGNLYGMTNVGGTHGFGVLYMYNPVTRKDTTLINFDTANGKEYGPLGTSLTLYPNNGLLYGMTFNGGKNQSGTLFCFDPNTGKDTVLVNLDNSKGTNPIEGTLTLNKANGLLYGVTSNGGSYDNGVLFSYSPVSGEYKVLVNFNVLNGSNPYGGLLLDTLNGLLYGMTYDGGNSGNGIIYSFDPCSAIQKVLVNFNNNNGSGPTGNLTLGANGNLYGMTEWDATGNGLLFCYNPVTAKDSVIFRFGYANGSEPYGSLLFVPDSSLTIPEAVTTKIITQDTKSKVCPNPNNGVFKIQVNSEEPKVNNVIDIYTMLGEKLYTAQLNSANTQVDLSNSAKGVYLYRISTEEGNQISNGKFIIQ